MEITAKDLDLRDYYVVIDRSGSMGESIKPPLHVSRWDAVKEYALTIARECEKLDDNGIDVYLFNRNFVRFENTTADKVADIFQHNAPQGGTDFIPVLTDVFERHFKNNKPSTVLVFTDGEPSEGAEGQKALAKLLINTANKLESGTELGVSFIQIGNDKSATAFLKKLDDDLVSAGAKFDIVDTKTCEELDNITIQDMLLAAVND